MKRVIVLLVLLFALSVRADEGSLQVITVENVGQIELISQISQSPTLSSLRELNLQFSSDSQLIGIIDGIAPWQNGDISFFDTDTFEPVEVFEDEQLEGTYLHFTRDWLLVGTDMGEVVRYDLATGNLIDRTIVSAGSGINTPFISTGGDVEVIATNPDETYVAVAATTEFWGQNVFYLSEFDGEPILEISTGQINGVGRGRGFSTVFFPTDYVVFAGFVENASGEWSSIVQIRDVNSGELVATCDSYRNALAYTHTLEITSDGEYIIYLADDGIRVWDGRNCADFPDAWRLLSTNYENEGVMTMTLHPTEPILAVSYVSSEQGRGTLRFWNIETEEMIGEITDFGEGVYNAITSLAFSPDGTMLASGGADGTVRLWGVPAGE